jgi:hypothetical protein
MTFIMYEYLHTFAAQAVDRLAPSGRKRAGFDRSVGSRPQGALRLGFPRTMPPRKADKQEPLKHFKEIVLLDIHFKRVT